MTFYKLDGQVNFTTTCLIPKDAKILIPNTTDGAYEKHVPVIEQSSDFVTVRVGSVAHPMLEQHYIQWIVLETTSGYQKKDLKPGEAPEASFAVTEPVVAAYEYCNLHGLWMGKA